MHMLVYLVEQSLFFEDCVVIFFDHLVYVFGLRDSNNRSKKNMVKGKFGDFDISISVPARENSA